MGRAYPIHWRLVFKRFELALIEDGALEYAVPEETRARIMECVNGQTSGDVW